VRLPKLLCFKRSHRSHRCSKWTPLGPTCILHWTTGICLHFSASTRAWPENFWSTTATWKTCEQGIRINACHCLLQPSAAKSCDPRCQSKLSIARHPALANAVRYVAIRRHCEKPTITSSARSCGLAFTLLNVHMRYRAPTPGPLFYRLCRLTWLALPGKGINIEIDLHCMFPVSRSPLSSRTSQFAGLLLNWTLLSSASTFCCSVHQNVK
jgi:hypothetical protein